MKRAGLFLTAAFCIAMMSSSAWAVTYYSQGSVTPSTLANWNTNRLGGGATPANFTTAGDIFVIQGTGNGGTSPHNMTTSAVWSVGAAGSRLQIENGGTLTATQIVTIVAGTTFQIDNGGNYIHSNLGTVSSTIFNGTESFGAISNFEIRLWGGTATSSTTSVISGLTASVVSGGNNYFYGNLTINTTTFTGIFSTGLTGTVRLCAGNLTFSSTGTSTVGFRFATTLTPTVFVLGNYSQATGTNVDGSSGVGLNLNLGGDYSLAGTAKLDDTGSGFVTIGFIKSSGTQTVSVSATAIQPWMLWTVGDGTTTNTVQLLSSINATGGVGFGRRVGSVTVNSNAILDLNGFILRIEGSTTGGVVVTGTLQGTAVNSRLLFSGTGTNPLSGAGTINGSNLTVECAHTSPGVLTIGRNLTVNTLTLTGTGTLLLNATTTLRTINLTNYSQTAGTLDTGSVDVTGGITSVTNLDGNFSKTSGTISNSSPTGLASLVFKGGVPVQTFANTGVFQYLLVGVTNNSNLTLNTALPFTDLSGNLLTIDLGSTVTAGTNQISTNGAGGNFVINGRLQTARTQGFSGLTTTTIISTNAPTVTLGVSSTIEYNGVAAQTISARTDYAILTLNNSAGGTLNGNTVVNNALNISVGTFSQGATFNLTTNTVTVSSGAAFQNVGTGDLTLSGNLSNSGTVTINANGIPCGDPDDILIRSSVTGVQRSWMGTGTFSIKDVNVQDQAGTALITVNSGTNAGNNGPNWVFISSCTGAAYTWNGLLLADWTVGTNWTPTRLVPDPGDVLIIDGSMTPAPTITNVPTQTIASLRIINGAMLTLTTTGTNTLTISGGTGSDLTVPSGSGLTLGGSGSALTISVASGSTGTIGGLMLFEDGTHSLIGNAANAITFQSGAFCTTAPGSYNDHPFGTGTGGDGTAGSVVFASGSNYFHNSGNSPFGAAASASVAVFQTGSLATWLTTSGFQASGRTYANLNVGKVAPSPVTVSLSDSGSGNFQFDNLQVSSDSSLTFNGSGASAVTIQGDITSDGLTANNDISLTAGTGGIILNKAGTQTFGASGGAKTITFGSNANVNAGTTLSLGRILIVSDPGVITVNGALTRTTGHVIGYEEIVFTATGLRTYEVGTVNGYSPVETNVTALGTNPSSLRIRAVQGPQPILNPATSLQRYWQLLETGDLTTDLTFHYLDPTDIAGTEANYRIIRVSGGTAVSFPNNCPGAPCVNPATNTGTIAGVSEFSDWTLGEPDAPTAVKLRSFAAKRTEDGVLLEWDSGFEVDNLGYNIYREQNGVRVRVTPSLVAGSALKTGQGAQLTAGMSYAWWDINASASAQYWLEDVDLDGKQTMYGPFTQQQAQAGAARPTASRLLSQLTDKNGLSSSAAQREWPATIEAQSPKSVEAVSRAQVSSLEQQFGLAGQAAVKLSVNQDGWYRVTRADLVAAGLNANADNARLQLYLNGEEQPIKVGTDGTVEFYGRRLEAPTTDKGVYWLIEGTTPGQRIQMLPTLPAVGQMATGFPMTVERRDRVIYFSSLQNGDASNIFGPIVGSQTASQSLQLRHPNAAASAPAQLEVALQGITAQNHLVSVSINGQQVGVVSFTGRAHTVWQTPVPMSALVEGANLVTLTRMNGEGDTSLVDYVRVTYARTYEAEANQLACTVQAGSTVKLGGFTTDDIHVFDVSDALQPRELNVTAEPDGQGFAVSFEAAQAARLVAFTGSSPMQQPAAMVANEPSAWNSLPNGAGMVVITHRDFRQAVEPLAAHRRAQGLSVAVIDVEDIYDEFSFSAHGPQAIKDFLDWTRQHWSNSPQYVLLVGDSSWDARNELGLSQSEFVPTRLIDTAFMETASDDWLADFNNDGIAEMAVGRLPVKTAAQAATIVQKIIGYDQLRFDPRRGAMLVADNGFESASQDIEAAIPQRMPVQMINRSSASDSVIRQQILNGINAGPRIVNYYGHGSVQVWTGAGLLQNSDAPNLTNGGKLAVFTLMNCLNGYAHDAYIDSLGEALLKAENGGAVAVWASSGYTESGGQTQINRQLYQQVFTNSAVRLGDAIRSAKGATMNGDVRRTWVLLGDPSMRVK